jgi:hypothetical protein
VVAFVEASNKRIAEMEAKAEKDGRLCNGACLAHVVFRLSAQAM